MKQPTVNERHAEMMKHFPAAWTNIEEKKEAFVSREELEKLLRSVLDSGDWVSRLNTLREVLMKLGVKCE